MSAESLPAADTVADRSAPAGCHHCGAPLGRQPAGAMVSGREVTVRGDACRTAVETIANAGLDAWYGFRTHAEAQGAATADPRHRAELDAWRVPEVEAAVVRSGNGFGGGASAVTLTVEGMRCAGCAWLVERLLGKIPGVNAAAVDFPLRRAEARFDSRTTRLHTLLEILAKAGYRAAPYTAHAEEAAIESERRARIRGLGISAVFGMQVMLLSIALYASGRYGGMDPGFEQLFRWLAMTLTVPVLVWPGRAYFTGAVAALRAQRLTMDVPVALGLSLAFLGSAFATVTGQGEIWFDSVVMFVTLLGGARYLELLARRRATATIRALARSAPLVATRVREGGSKGDGDGGGAAVERVPAASLHPGDRVRVRPGEVVPADGVVRSGESAFDESLLNGESAPVARAAGGDILAGSVNGSGVVEIEVTCTGDGTVLGGMLRRAERAAAKRPAIALLADRAAGWFIAGVLVLAAGVAAGWLLHDPARMIPVLVSVLVVTCPCALSLATPAAMTAALGGLARAGLVATRAKAVERLALVTHCLADKTGALTEGRFRLRSVSVLAGVSESRCLAIAAALERYATHPAASAIVAAAGRFRGEDDGTAQPGGTGLEANTVGRKVHGAGSEVEDVSAQTGGVTGRIDGIRYAVGSPEFVTRACRLMPAAFGSSAGRNEARARIPPHSSAAGADPSAAKIGEGSGFAAPACEAALGGSGSAARIGEPETATSASGSVVGAGGDDDGTRAFLARDGALLARFILADTLRADAGELIEGLRARGIETTIASGDSADAVERAADALGVAHRLAGLSPEDKLDEAVRLAARGERVLMLGDGTNDAPALAGAHASVAMGRGAAAAASRAAGS